jgi:hypothetical protein
MDKSMPAGTPSSPTNLGAWSDSNVFITMITQSSSVGNNSQGQSELTVKARSQDIIRWTIQTFDGNSDYTAYLYNGRFNPAGNISALNYSNAHVSSYLPPGSSPTAPPALFHNNSYSAWAMVLEPGQTIQYYLSFVLVDNSTGQILGYFYWDPFIAVSK